MPRADLPVISLFTGAMGLDLGLERAGFRIAVAVECNRYAVETIQRNRPDVPVIDKKIDQVTTQEILHAAGLRPGDPVVVSGGPSCQVFSTAGPRRSLGDPRGVMFREFLRVVREAKPRFFVMENVRGLLSAAIRHRPLDQRGPGREPLATDEELGSALRTVVNELKLLRYYVKFDLLNAADFGVPQVRHRLVFIGSRLGEAIEMPAKTHAEVPGPRQNRWRTLRDVIGELQETDPEFYNFCPSKERYLRLVPSGGNWRDLPEHAKAKALGSAFRSWGGRSGFFRRLDWDKPSPALTTRPDSKATSLCHPIELRPLSVGEYSRIQEFLDEWVFSGPIRQKYRQVGNAVPVRLGAAIGGALRKTMRKRKRPGRKGVVECENLDLLLKMARRPTTILNPPRMRDDPDGEHIADWLQGRTRKRTDVVDYAAPHVREELLRLLALPRRKKRKSATTEKEPRQSQAKGKTGDGPPHPYLRLAAAE